MKADELETILNPSDFVGRAPQQTEEFIRDFVNPVLEKNQELLGVEVELTV